MVNKKSLATFVRTVGNQVIAGFKHFLNNVKIGGDLIHDPDPLGSAATNVLTVDAEGVVRKATSFTGGLSGGTVTSVALTAPSAFTVSGSPITTSGTIAIVGAGTASQYVRGDGQLADFPTSGGGGSSVSYYLNGSVNQGTLGGNVYHEFSKIPILGSGTDFSIAADGYIAQFITDANDPSLLEIPGGNWNLEFYFSSSSSGGTPSFYVELSKYDGTTFTPIASNSSFPEFIAFGTIISPYFSTLAVPQTTLAVTDRLAIRVYVIHSGRTITLHTEDNHLCQVITTFSTGLNALNGLTKQVQYFATGTSGTNFNISSVGDTHTFNIPTASGSNRGLLSNSDWINFTAAYNDKINSAAVTGTTTKTLTLTQRDGDTITASWTDYDTAPVTSVFGRTGAVIAVSGDYNTSQVTENTNLYFTNARARTAISLTTTGTSGAATYDNATGVLNVPQYQSVLTNPVTGTGTTNYVTKWTTSSNIGNSQIFDNGTNVGIGTATPATKLHVNGGSDYNTTFSSDSFRSGWAITSPGTSTVRGSALVLSSDNSFRFGTASYYHISMNVDGSTQIFNTSGSVATTFASGGNVGIGTTNPLAKLDVVGHTYIRGGLLYVDTIAGYSAGAVSLAGSTNFIVPSGNVGIGTTSPSTLLQISGTGNTFTRYTNTTNAGHFMDVGSNSSGQHFVFGYGAYPMLFGTNGSEVIRITSGGNVGIGTTSPSAKLNVSGDIHVGDYGTSVLRSFELRTFNSILTIQTDGTSGGLGTNISYSWANGGQGPLTFSNAAGEVMRLSATGNVGIGTTAPDAKLHVNPATVNEIAIAINGTQNYSANSFQRISAGDPSSLNRVAIGFGYNSTPEWTIRYSSYHNHEFFTGNDWGSSTEKMRITAAGNVGIGTTSPSSLLEIAGPSPVLTINRTSGTSSTINFNSSGSNFASIISNPSNGENRFSIGPAAAWGGFHTFYTDTSERMRITSAGNVGIGTTSPATRLHVDASGHAMVVSNDTGNRRIYFGTGGTGEPDIQATLSNGTARQLSINAAGGNVGIGTTNPSAKLHVDGAAIISYSGTNANYFGQSNGAIGYGRIRPFANSGLFAFDTNYTFGGGYDFAYNNSSIVRITSTGNVGIGTTSPAHKLTVDGDSSEGSIGIERTTVSANTVIGALNFTNNNSGTVYGRVRGGRNAAGDGYVSLGTGLGDNLYAIEGGNVGIGTTSPATKLVVESGGFAVQGTSSWPTSGFGLEFWNAGPTSYIGAFNRTTSAYRDMFLFANDTIFENGGSQRMRITAAGNVGIGTTSPSQALHVSGNVRVTGAYYDSINSAGTSGQVLSSTGSGTAWVNQGEATATSLFDLLPAARVTYDWTVQLTAGTWADIFSSNTVLSNGTWMVQAYVNDFAVGGQQYQETYSGIMSWGSASSTNDTGPEAISEIVLHRSGHAANSGNFYLRTVERAISTLLFQGMSNQTYSAASTINFKFVKIF